MSANNISGRLKNRETAELLKVYKVRVQFLGKRIFCTRDLKNGAYMSILLVESDG